MNAPDPDLAPAIVAPQDDADARVQDPLSMLFAPSPTKLALLCTTSLGGYAVYWFYRNWRALRLLSGRLSIWPVPRSVFSWFWVFTCFRGLEDAMGTPRSVRSEWLGPALVYVVLSANMWVFTLAWLYRYGLGVFGLGQTSLSAIDMNSALISLPVMPVLLAWTPLLIVNARLRRFKQTRGLPKTRREERFDGWTWTWLALAGLPISLLVVGLLLMTALDGYNFHFDYPHF